MSGARGIIYSMSEAFYDSQRHHFQEHQFHYQQYKEATLTTAMVPFSGALVPLSAVKGGNICRRKRNHLHKDQCQYLHHYHQSGNINSSIFRCNTPRDEEASKQQEPQLEVPFTAYQFHYQQQKETTSTAALNSKKSIFCSSSRQFH